MPKELGTIDKLPSGKFRLRLSIGKTRKSFVGTLEQCQSMRTLYNQDADAGKVTLASVHDGFFAHRAKLGLRSTNNDMNRWKNHIGSKSISKMDIKKISTVHIEEWFDKLSGSPQTKKHALSLMRAVLEYARRPLRLIEVNPGRQVRFNLRIPDKWTYLSVEEQRRLLSSEIVPQAERVLIKFAIGTGLRQGEQWALQLCDVHIDTEKPYLLVRWGSKGKPPKNGKVRKVPLFSLGLEAAREWMEILPSYIGKHKNDNGLMFPTVTGCYRRWKKPPRGWQNWLDKLKIRGCTGNKVVWHSLRHTAATNLACGVYGRAWRLIEIRDFLGHSSVEMCERYAHLTDDALMDAAASTGGHSLVTNKTKNSENAVRHAGFEPAPFDSGGPLKTHQSQAVTKSHDKQVTSLGESDDWEVVYF